MITRRPGVRFPPLLMISENTRNSWDEKIKTIQEAIKRNLVNLYPSEPRFLNNISKRRQVGQDISRKQSKWLNRIFERIQ